MDGSLYLVVDLGTGGPKVGLVDASSALVDYVAYHVETTFADDGQATQDADQWWDLIVRGFRQLLEDRDRARRVRAIGVTGQYGSTVPVDANGRPTGPCLTWMDTRGGALSRRAVGGPIQGYNPRAVLSFIRRSGGAPSTSGADPVGHVLYLEHERPEVAAATRWYLEPVDYVTMRLTGVPCATHASRLAMWMTDNRHLSRYHYDSVLLGLVGLSDEKLAPLVPFGSSVGPVSASVAAELGLPPSTIVATGIPDLHAATIGSGATGPYETHLALSTTSWISCPVPAKKTDVLHSIASVPGLDSDHYLVINNQETGARALEWIRDQLAGTGPAASFDELTDLAATVGAGSNGVRFAPWLAGERSPADDKHARGGFSNLSITTTPADLVRAVLEGVAANSAWLFGRVEHFTGRRLEPVRLIGGGAQSELWCQIYANTLDRRVIQVAEPLIAQLRGVAHVAASAVGDVDLGDPPTPKGGRTFEPDPRDRETYAAIAHELPRRFATERHWRRAIR